jgi:hypothetical protein
MEINHEQIIQAVRDRAEDHPYVYALWLEGADSTGTVDEYYDIDFWFDVEDAHVEKEISEL